MNLLIGFVVRVNDSRLNSASGLLKMLSCHAAPRDLRTRMKILMKAKFAMAICLGLTEAMAFASGSGTAFLRISTYIPPQPPAVIVQTLNANKEVLATYEMSPSQALEKAHELSMMEEAKAKESNIRTISVTFY